ncbi:hypothetical protein ACFO4O_16360 [Glaciecola siphonariae]|uniref:Phage protein n=1 Tax=Glaciecola siphonariae TaxID=521012 RepID=A0ABV9LZH3_9ALTE
MKKFIDWDIEINGRWLDAAHSFGYHLFKQMRADRIAALPIQLSNSEREVAIKAIDDTIYTFMMMFDGIYKFDIDNDHSAEYALIQRIRDNNDDVVSEIELAPDGDELTIGFHGWKENDFGE